VELLGVVRLAGRRIGKEDGEREGGDTETL
jgi:hypothetical protein